MSALTAPAVAAAPDGEGGGYVWANVASAELRKPYVPAPGYQYNSTSPNFPVNTVERISVGHYQVTFPGLLSRNLDRQGGAHVTAYGGIGTTCNLIGTGRNFVAGYTQLSVWCFSPAAQAVDSQFTASLTTVESSWRGRPMAYMLATPEGHRGDFNSMGESNSVTPTGVGSYVVRMPRLGVNGGHVQVTAVGHFVRCRTGGWWTEGPTQAVSVTCADLNGNPRHTSFMFTFIENLNILGLSTGFNPDGHDSAYAWANDPWATTPYRPTTTYQFNNDANDIAEISRLGTGQYVVRFPRSSLHNGNVQVTTYGWASEYCGVAHWVLDGIRVNCHNGAGAPADAFFDVAFVGPYVTG
jgi:hypothetical protein